MHRQPRNGVVTSGSSLRRLRTLGQKSATRICTETDTHLCYQEVHEQLVHVLLSDRHTSKLRLPFRQRHFLSVCRLHQKRLVLSSACVPDEGRGTTREDWPCGFERLWSRTSPRPMIQTLLRWGCSYAVLHNDRQSRRPGEVVMASYFPSARSGPLSVARLGYRSSKTDS